MSISLFGPVGPELLVILLLLAAPLVILVGILYGLYKLIDKATD
jgi:hypothetical protein